MPINLINHKNNLFDNINTHLKGGKQSHPDSPNHTPCAGHFLPRYSVCNLYPPLVHPGT